jgi:hypothetical protein
VHAIARRGAGQERTLDEVLKRLEQREPDATTGELRQALVGPVPWVKRATVAVAVGATAASPATTKKIGSKDLGANGDAAAYILEQLGIEAVRAAAGDEPKFDSSRIAAVVAALGGSLRAAAQTAEWLTTADASRFSARC